MPAVPQPIARFLGTIEQPLDEGGRKLIFDPKEYEEEELGWVHGVVGPLLGYFLHKAMLSLPSANSLVLDSGKGVIRTNGTSFHALYKITNSLLLGWSDSHLLAFFIPDDGEWHGLIKVIWEQGLWLKRLKLEALAVYQVVDNLDELKPKGGSWLKQVAFPVGTYPWFDKTRTVGCVVSNLADPSLAKALFRDHRREGGELVGYAEALALVDVEDKKAAVKLWGPGDFFFDSTHPEP